MVNRINIGLPGVFHHSLQNAADFSTKRSQEIQNFWAPYFEHVEAVLAQAMCLYASFSGK